MNRTLLVVFITLLAVTARAAADFATEMMEATFKFDNQGSYATGFLVRRDAPDTTAYLVTVAHALEDTKEQSVVLVLRRSAPDGSYERYEHTISLRRDGRPLWIRHEKHDVAVLPLVDPLPFTVPALPLSALADEARLKSSGVHLCSPLFVLGYPMGLEGAASGIPVARQGIFASPPLLPLATHPTFRADYSAFKGDSGGPVFIAGTDNHPLVVGMAIEQYYFDQQTKTMNEEQSIRNPLGVVKVLHAQYIRDTIEALAKTNGSLRK